MYGISTNYNTSKAYYNYHDFQFIKFQKIKELIANNEYFDAIQASIDYLKKINSIFINNTSLQYNNKHTFYYDQNNNNCYVQNDIKILSNIMYGINPFFYKHKFYYEYEDINFTEFKKIEKMLVNNEPVAAIQASIDNLEKLNSIFINNTRATQCPTIGILSASISKMTILESLISRKNIFSVTTIPIETSIKTEINVIYFKYIKKYGVPEDGIFLPDRLSEFE